MKAVFIIINCIFKLIEQIPYTNIEWSINVSIYFSKITFSLIIIVSRWWITPSIRYKYFRVNLIICLTIMMIYLLFFVVIQKGNQMFFAFCFDVSETMRNECMTELEMKQSTWTTFSFSFLSIVGIVICKWRSENVSF